MGETDQSPLLLSPTTTAPLVITRHKRHHRHNPLHTNHARPPRHCTLYRLLAALTIVTLVTIIYWSRYMTAAGPLVHLIGGRAKARPEPNIRCGLVNGGGAGGGGGGRLEVEHKGVGLEQRGLRVDPKVLVFVETMYSKLGKDIAELLVHTRIKYKVEAAGKSLPVLTNLDKGRYAVIIFESYSRYLDMDNWNRQLLDKYCREYGVGIIGFVGGGQAADETLIGAEVRGFPLYVHTNLRLRDAGLNGASQVLRLVRAGETVRGRLPGDDWAAFTPNHSTYEPLEWAHRHDDYHDHGSARPRTPLTTTITDHGLLDSIQRVLFGSGLQFWLHRLLLLDALSYLSHGLLSLPLERQFLVDIDDIFVGEVGTRIRADDVIALVEGQRRIQEVVSGFRFNLGFSGKYYHHGNDEEDRGDDELLKYVGEFMWFSHMWNHQQPHLYENVTQLMEDMQMNKNFAKDKGIPVDSGYSVSPHHSGVYPAHDLLYTAWKRIWNIRVTSTEEYPHLRPARCRRGFIHRKVMVLPRQTCGLFTHTMLIDRYPGGRVKLDESIMGGELFQTIVYNRINVFMTHMSNYGNDRLGLYTFESVVKFLQCWTNVRLTSAPPLQLGEAYFHHYPEEADPVWGNPCEDPRHQRIWSRNKSCDSLPQFLVIGPQKTGTTALYSFLAMHPSIASNLPSPVTFEEIQFFNGNNYYRGLDWYMSFFPANGGEGSAGNNGTSSTSHVLFEKSATYFDGEQVPKRVQALLPRAKLVTILISPAKRAYSWYQHIRAHGDSTALNYTFHQVITATDTAARPLRDLRNRCLTPGRYAQHLERWLQYFPAPALHIIDGDQLRSAPAEALADLQKFLKIAPLLNYTNHLRYDARKGFFCQRGSGEHNKCLGASKGRHYPPMEEADWKLLHRYYLSHNTALLKLLRRIGRTVPHWLKEDLMDPPPPAPPPV